MESLVVILIIGVIAAVIAAAFTVIARTAPQAQARDDDSKSLLSLTNWLTRDVASTSESGFQVGDVATQCQTTSVPASQGVVQLTWGSYVANYRWLTTAPGKGRLYRYTCTLGGPAESLALTPEMNNAPSGSPLPMAPAPIAAVKTSTTTPTSVVPGLQFKLYAYDAAGNQRELLELNATSRNVRTFLSPGGGGGGGGSNPNRPPVAADWSVQASRGEVAVRGPLPATDPDADTPLWAEFNADSWNPVASWVSDPIACAPSPACLQVTFNVPNSAQPSDPPHVIGYRVCDRDPATSSPPRQCSSYFNMSITIVPPPDNPPGAGPFGFDIEAGLSASEGLPIGDEDVRNVTVALDEGTAQPIPAAWNPTVSWNNPSQRWLLEFATASGDVGTYQLLYKVTDQAGQENPGGWQLITIDVTPVVVDNPPIANPVAATAAAAVPSNAQLLVSDEDVASLTYEFDNVPSGWAQPTVDSSGLMSFTPLHSAVGPVVFRYRVTDSIGQRNTSSNPQGWVDITIDVLNGMPTVGPVISNASKSAPLTLLLPAFDPEGQPLSISFPVRPAGWPTPTVTQTASGPQITLTPPASATGSNVYTYRATDTAGQFNDATITLTVCTITSITIVADPGAPSANAKVYASGVSTGDLTQPVTITIDTNNACGSLVAAFNPGDRNGNAAATEWVSFNASNQAVIPAASAVYVWDIPPMNGTNRVTIRVRQGFNGADEGTREFRTEQA